MLATADRGVTMDAVVDQVPGWDGKHPLSDTWVLWYSDQSLSKDWHNCIKQVGSFDTVEDFWCIFNFLKPVSMVKPGCDFYLFKKGIQPMWEDQANKQGGRWDLSVERGLNDDVDKYWMEVLMAVVGGGLHDDGDIVTGACVSRRDRNRISIWTAVSDDRGKLFSLGQTIKRILDLPDEPTLLFRPHQDSSNYRKTSFLRC